MQSSSVCDHKRTVRACAEAEAVLRRGNAPSQSASAAASCDRRPTAPQSTLILEAALLFYHRGSDHSASPETSEHTKTRSSSLCPRHGSLVGTCLLSAERSLTCRSAQTCSYMPTQRLQEVVHVQASMQDRLGDTGDLAPLPWTDGQALGGSPPPRAHNKMPSLPLSLAATASPCPPGAELTGVGTTP